MERFGVLEQHSARSAGLLTERTRKLLAKARPTPSQRHVEAKNPGDLVCFDCFYVGKLKGVGKVWQITACDAASSFAWARVFIGDPRAIVAAAFLRDVAHELRQVGWPLQRVLTDRGSEFKGKSSAILSFSRPNGQPPHFSQDSGDLRSRARVTVPGFRTARRVASRR
jgi:hypothetical protein